MKVILSRKGFDSSSGGFPSPVFPDGTMLSIPIPEITNEEWIKYSDLQISGNAKDGNIFRSYYELMNKLYGSTIKIDDDEILLTEETKCHLDPDLVYERVKRKCSENEWKAMFGQIGTWEEHLQNQGVDVGDLFLFFGKFRRADERGTFIPSEKEFHAIYGYMRVGEVYRCRHCIEQLKCEHPHTQKNYLKDKGGKILTNGIYQARDGLDLEYISIKESYGVFTFNEKRVLTDMDSNGKRRSVTKWKVQEFMRDEKLKISCHENTSLYGIRRDDRDKEYFQSVSRGQEFVMECTDEVEDWIKEIL